MENHDFPPVAEIPRIKICGLRRAEDALLALELGASFLGLIMTQQSPRHIALGDASKLVAEVRRKHPAARFIGVFVKEPAEEIALAMSELRLCAVQVHADVTPLLAQLAPRVVIPGLSIRDEHSAARIEALHSEHPAIVADAFVEGKAGGTGKVFDHRLVLPAMARRRVFIAGGLGPENIAGAVEALLGEGALPYAFDLSSGVEEAPGVKSEEKLRSFFARYLQSIHGGRC